MSSYKFIKNYIQMQKGIVFDSIINLELTVIATSKIDKTVYWNYALVNSVTGNKIGKIEQIFIKKKRTPAIYFENRPVFNELITELKSNGFVKNYEDTWLFWNNVKLDKKHFENVKKVENIEDLEIFLKTYDKTNQADDPQNPYGELGEYLDTVRQAWISNKDTNKLEYFIVFKDEKPVAVSALTNYNGSGYISNVGSLRRVRGEGFGKAATLYCIQKSIQNGNEKHFIITEKGTFPFEFYKRIGFVPKFTTLCYTKGELSQ